MTGEQAERLTAHLSGLMPRMTDELIKAAAGQLLQVSDPEAAGRAIQRYAQAARDFVLADFIACLPPRPRPPDENGPVQRTARSLAEEKKRQEELENEWKPIREAIAAMSDAELARAKADVLDEAEANGDKLLPILERQDPRRSPLLQSMIFRRLAKAET